LTDIRDQGLRLGRVMSIMESMGKKKPRPRRSFTPEFKAEIVELCRRGDCSVGHDDLRRRVRVGKPSPATTMAVADRAIRVRRSMRSTTGSASAEPTG
jgi:transposase-like protein